MKQTRLDDVLKPLEKFLEDEDSEGSPADESVTDINTTKKVTAFISPPNIGLITDED